MVGRAAGNGYSEPGMETTSASTSARRKISRANSYQEHLLSIARMQ